MKQAFELSEFEMKSSRLVEDIERFRHEIMGVGSDISNHGSEDENVAIFNMGSDLIRRSGETLDTIGVDLRYLQHLNAEDTKDAVKTIQALMVKVAALESEVTEARSQARVAQNFAREARRQFEERLAEHSPSNPEVRAKVYALTDGKCAYCDKPISSEPEDKSETFVVEHVVPKNCGGPDHLTNYVPSCPTCNSQKRTSHVVDFIRKKAAL